MIITKIRNESRDITNNTKIKNYKKIIWRIIYQQIRKPRWNEQISRNIQII